MTFPPRRSAPRLASLCVGVITLAFVASSCRTVGIGIRNGRFNEGNDGWTLGPGGGHPGPRILVLGNLRGIFIGRSQSEEADGNATSQVSQAFRCGDSPEGWCTVDFDAINEQQDGELLKVTLRQGNNSRIGYIKLPSMRRYNLSIRGCTENEIRFEMTEGSAPKLQSMANVTKISSKCTDRDMTNVLGPGGATHELTDAEGKPLVPQTP